MANPIVYTIGHSTHPLDYFLTLLQEYAVNCLIDVRSVAASAYNPQYNKEPFSNYLQKNKISYLHFVEEFGARQADPDVLDENGKVDFEKVWRSRSFNNGVARLRSGIDKGYTMALMCAESDPLDCHRFYMITVALQRDGFEVGHIMKDKSLRSTSDLEELLIERYAQKLPKPDMFRPLVTREEQLEAACRLRRTEIAFSSKGR
jgi:uncharacterized protein (DUF488 family)